MYEKLDRSSDGVVGYELGGELTEREFDDIVGDLEAEIDEHGSVRLLVALEDVPRPDLSLLDDDVAFWLHHRDDLDRYAVVSDGSLVEWAVDLGDRLVDTDVEHFDDRDAAWQWLERDGAAE
ncbi:STAS/SEC14 domain-containing protein [Halobaculum sp. P14]|uniref:STAS/SEC14 domain-containing protein n=1 Tax=Halobaculum sp. P14 TaxID=3421638 RepID=UPI003EBBFD16